MSQIFSSRKPVKKKIDLSKIKFDLFKATRLAGVIAVILAFIYHQSIATPEHMNFARILSFCCTAGLFFYEFVIYRREMKRRKLEQEAKDNKTLRETIKSSVNEELRNRG